MNVFLATQNVHKVREIAQIVFSEGITVSSADALGGMPEVDENAGSFAGNARLKAESLRRRLPPDGWALADDSGLEVDALGGAPGVYSSRFAGAEATDEDNLDKLLRALKEIDQADRKARFRCVLALSHADGRHYLFDGTCEGSIALARSGEGGFGYDPVFVPAGYESTFADLGAAVKDQLSHRARALASMMRWIREDPAKTFH